MHDSNQPDDDRESDETAPPYVSVIDGEKDAGSQRPSDQTDIYIRAEIEGPGEQVLSRLVGSPEPGDEFEYDGLQPLVEDMTTILDAIDRTGGGIRSKITDETDVGLTDEGVRHMLELLREYDLLTLEGNSWRPGPPLDSEHD